MMRSECRGCRPNSWNSVFGKSADVSGTGPKKKSRPMLERISVNWERFVESRAREAYTAAMVELGVLAEKHIYLRLLYTRSFGCFSVNGYDQAEIQAIALDLKEFAKQFSETRKQVEKFLKCVLDVDSAGREPQKQAAKKLSSRPAERSGAVPI